MVNLMDLENANDRFNRFISKIHNYNSPKVLKTQDPATLDLLNREINSILNDFLNLEKNKLDLIKLVEKLNFKKDINAINRYSGMINKISKRIKDIKVYATKYQRS